MRGKRIEQQVEVVGDYALHLITSSSEVGVYDCRHPLRFLDHVDGAPAQDGVLIVRLESEPDSKCRRAFHRDPSCAGSHACPGSGGGLSTFANQHRPAAGSAAFGNCGSRRRYMKQNR